MPKCNGSSFAEHYVGCRSEECCQAKRISHVTSGDPSPSPVDSNSAYLVPTGKYIMYIITNVSLCVMYVDS